MLSARRLKVLDPALANFVMAKMGISACFFFYSISFCDRYHQAFFLLTCGSGAHQKCGHKGMASIKGGIIYHKNNPVVSKTITYSREESHAHRRFL